MASGGRRQSESDVSLLTNCASLYETAWRRLHRECRVDHGVVGWTLSERVVSGRERWRDKPDARPRARVGRRWHSRERGRADLRRYGHDEGDFREPGNDGEGDRKG